MPARSTAAAIVLLTAMPAIAGTTIPSLTSTELVTTSSDAWHWRFNLYGWVEALEGDLAILGRTSEVDLGFDDVLNNLDVAFMGAMEVSHGRWSFLADISYAEVSGSKASPVAYTRLGIDQLISHFIASYAVVDTESTRLDVYAGGRVNSLDVDLNILTNRLAIGTSASKASVDPIIGVGVSHDLSERFFLRARGDIGGFGVASDFTWQAMALLGYRVNDNSSLLLGYRGIGTDYTDGGFAYDVVSHGPVLGFDYKFWAVNAASGLNGA